jgi:hypothetical protein
MHFLRSDQMQFQAGAHRKTVSPIVFEVPDAALPRKKFSCLDTQFLPT